MGNDLQLDASCLDNVNNAMRRHAALTVCERTENKADRLLALLMIGLATRTDSGGYTELGADEGVTWSRSHREPAPPRIRPR